MRREDLEIGGAWRFQPDPYGEGVAAGFAAARCDDGRWPEIRVPCGFEACAAGLETYEGAGWYRRSVEVPAAWRGRRVVLRFEGVNHHARVWVNGRCVGEHGDAFLPFELPVGAALRWGGPNVIAVLVDNERRPGEIPPPRCGWRSYGGILREVRLVATGPVHVAGVAVRAEPDGQGGTLAVTASVANETDAPAAVRLAIAVAGSDGRILAELASEPVVVPVGRSEEIRVEGAVAGVRSWRPAEPALYTAAVALHTEAGPADAVDVRFGFRRIETSGTGLLLNGEPIFLTGFNRHEDSPRTAMASDLATARADLTEMKRAGANFVRLCHYPHHPGEIDLCDELGLLVMCEIPLYWWRGRAGGDEASAATLSAAKRQLTTLIRRDANHPSVIFWSVSNETHEQHAEVAAGNAELIRLARRLDPTRLAVHVSDHWREQSHFEADDVLCVNAYPTWFGRLTPANPSYDLADSTRHWRRQLDRLHRAWPDKPILVTEFGYPSLAGVFDGPMGEDVQAAAIEAESAGMDAPQVCGMTIWCYADHPWPEEEFIRRVTTSPFGVVARDRRKLAAFETVRRLFRARQEAWRRRGGRA